MVQNMSTAEVNNRLAKIYMQLNRMQELADKVMFHPFLDNVIKGVFLNWYEMKLEIFKNELSSCTNETISDDAEVSFFKAFFFFFLKKTFSFLGMEFIFGETNLIKEYNF